MLVFVVRGWIDNGGSDVLGIFGDSEEAGNFALQQWDDLAPYDYITVVEWDTETQQRKVLYRWPES